jgi:thioredoxin reductase
MAEHDVIIVGGGPAGMAAAGVVARHGLCVGIIEQRQKPGGAIYRQPIAGVTPVARSRAAGRRFQSLLSDLDRPGVNFLSSRVFLGIDADGYVLCEDRTCNVVERLKARVVILATGAVERILPRPGWELDGVSTAGGLQLMMKETARSPAGRVLLAGSGPLLVAVAAQMASLGNPPVAIIEAGDPLRQIARGLGLLAHPALLAEALSYMVQVEKSPARWIRASNLAAIERKDGLLQCEVVRSDGKVERFEVDRVGLHDGIVPNSLGLPAARGAYGTMPLILHAGDCREALGAVAAGVDGARAGLAALVLAGKTVREAGLVERALEKQRHAQTILASLFAPVRPQRLGDLPDNTLLCRCEGRTVGDLRNLVDRDDALTGREVKHNGRFAMGSCQGRFCAAATAALMSELRPGDPPASAKDITGQRWPLRPVSIAALIHAAPDQTPIED